MDIMNFRLPMLFRPVSHHMSALLPKLASSIRPIRSFDSLVNSVASIAESASFFNNLERWSHYPGY